LGRIQWQATGVGVVVVAAERIAHPNYNPITQANDIALLRLPNPVPINSKYFSPVLTYVVVCVAQPPVMGVTALWLLHILV